ncbi:TPR-REGION domain-containing protein [Mycena indigotica]|uniref:TPR-REGION domain-containing protein n=1 Tax=Mycena indigotica TaxID=2126181 RepID=A0A8H6SZ71_9AGAR|nr:TPR-REGION domain-containing protein [Mycena indigotica]KAF7307346.1 TPR-REGION domain-containing protein [Mycena indigotica]
MSNNSDVVNALKLEGNTFHQQNDFKAAHSKYTQAINVCDPADTGTLAILFANRAASSLNLKNYLDALHDGRQATTADPTYAKGFIRVATAADAIDMWAISSEAWSKMSELTSDATQKAIYRAKSEAARSKNANHEVKLATNSFRTEFSTRQLPWTRAIAMLENGTLPPGPGQSSGHVIIQAYTEFKPGLDNLRRISITPRANGVMVIPAGKVLEPFINGILCDPRAFHADIPDFFEKLTRQIRAEVENSKGWPSSGPTQIMQDIPRKLQESNWAAVRPAIAITIRAWIFRAFMNSNMGQEAQADEFYKRAVDVIEWGRRKYPNVPREDRGSIFEATILRGVRTLRLQNILTIGDHEGNYTLEDIENLALELKSETEASERPTAFNGYGFFAFWTYPLAEAISALGWVHMRRGFALQRRSEELGEDSNGESPVLDKAEDEYALAAQYYYQAAETYPEDDIHHVEMLLLALEAEWRGCSSLKATFPLARRISKAVPVVSKIWQAKINQHITAKLKEVTDFLEDCQRNLSRGIWTIDESCGPPHYFVAPPTALQSGNAGAHDSNDSEEET